jgi:hypothetical protein
LEGFLSYIFWYDGGWQSKRKDGEKKIRWRKEARLCLPRHTNEGWRSVGVGEIMLAVYINSHFLLQGRFGRQVWLPISSKEIFNFARRTNDRSAGQVGC